MSAIWSQGAAGWELLSPEGFPNEDELHTLVADNPQLLPLAGAPDLVVLGREVALGAGKADLLAVELVTGRLVVIEVKLARNAEARRAVVAQILTYAAYLRGLSHTALQEDVLSRHLAERGHSSVAGLVAAQDQQGAFVREDFDAGLDESLRTGRFRLVLVLDEAPSELVRLVGYLESVTDELLIDLVAVTHFDVHGTSVMVPQRVDPAYEPTPLTPVPARRGAVGTETSGPEVFLASIEELAPERREPIMRLADWALALEREGLCRLSSYQGVNGVQFTLLPRLLSEKVGLVTIWNDGGKPSMSLWRSVFDRRAPTAMAEIQARYGDDTIRQGNTLAVVDDQMLELLTAAYREAHA